MTLTRGHRFTVATRLTAAFVLAAGIAGALAGLVFARSLKLGLDDGLDVGLRSRAAALTAQLTPRTPAAFAAQLRSVRATSGLTQVLGPSGEVLAATSAAGSSALLGPADRRRAAAGTYIIDAARTLPASAGSRPHSVEIRLLGTPLTGGELVVVGTPEDTVSDAVSETAAHLFVAGVIGLVLAAIGARLLVGAALRPVETARREVERASQDETAPELIDPGGEDEFSRLVRTFNGLLNRQNQLLQAERTFTADAGHELRTPLAILSGELELAARPQRTPAEVALALAVAKDETDRLTRLTEQLLMLARGDRRTLVARAPGDISDVLRAAVAAMQPMAALANVEIQAISTQPVIANIDADQLRLALDNLLRNAIRFAPVGTSIEVSLDQMAGTGQQPGTCRLQIADEGPGFADAFVPHAFDRFRRDDQARGRNEDAHGAGLGLAIVKAIVEAHDGVVFAGHRSPGPGAVVGFDLPLTGTPSRQRRV